MSYYQSVPDYLGILGQSVLSYWTDLTVPAAVHHVACNGLTALSLENTTILGATHISAGSSISTLGSCQSIATSSVEACRVYGVISTTSESSVKFEIWLPDTWYGRFLTVGNGGLGGC
jgi:Tannase and feruloyl esterase